MVLRTFDAFDNESLLISAASPSGTAGSPIINNSDTPDGTIFTYQSGFTAQEITLDDTNDVNVFNDDQAGNHIITNGGGLVANGQSVESESIIVLRALDGTGTPVGPEITITVFSQGGSFSNIWGFGASQGLVPGTSYVKISGSNAGASDYTSFVPCFAEGTPVRLASGATKPVEDLAPGDLIWTEDRGPCPLLHMAVSRGHGQGNRAPIEIAPGVLGNMVTIRVSPQHRIVVDGPEAQLMFGTNRLLVPAVHLVGMPGVTRAPADAVNYHHLIFDGHRIVDTGGLLSESFYPGAQAMAHLDAPVQREIADLFPGLAEAPPPPIAPTLKAHEGRMLAGALARRSTASR